MDIVAVKTKFQIVIPQHIREQVKVEIGDLLEAGVKDGKIIFEYENTIYSTHDLTQHAETGLIGKATQKFDPDTLAACTMYASTEPCTQAEMANDDALCSRFVWGRITTLIP